MRALVYVDAFVPDEGETVFQILGGSGSALDVPDPSTVLDLVGGSVANVLGDAARQAAIVVPPAAAALAIALPIVYVVGRLAWVAWIDLSGRGPGSAETPAPTEAAS